MIRICITILLFLVHQVSLAEEKSPAKIEDGNSLVRQNLSGGVYTLVSEPYLELGIDQSVLSIWKFSFGVYGIASKQMYSIQEENDSRTIHKVIPGTKKNYYNPSLRRVPGSWRGVLGLQAAAEIPLFSNSSPFFISGLIREDVYPTLNTRYRAGIGGYYQMIRGELLFDKDRRLGVSFDVYDDQIQYSFLAFSESASVQATFLSRYFLGVSYLARLKQGGIIGGVKW
jgi:hypothetical protein